MTKLTTTARRALLALAHNGVATFGDQTIVVGDVTTIRRRQALALVDLGLAWVDHEDAIALTRKGELLVDELAERGRVG